MCLQLQEDYREIYSGGWIGYCLQIAGYRFVFQGCSLWIYAYRFVSWDYRFAHGIIFFLQCDPKGAIFQDLPCIKASALQVSNLDSFLCILLQALHLPHKSPSNHSSWHRGGPLENWPCTNDGKNSNQAKKVDIGPWIKAVIVVWGPILTISVTHCFT